MCNILMLNWQKNNEADIIIFGNVNLHCHKCFILCLNSEEPPRLFKVSLWCIRLPVSSDIVSTGWFVREWRRKSGTVNKTFQHYIVCGHICFESSYIDFYHQWWPFPPLFSCKDPMFLKNNHLSAHEQAQQLLHMQTKQLDTTQSQSIF